MISSQHSAQGKIGKAFREGEAAALKGGEAFCPYRKGTKSRQQWELGYNSTK